MYMRDKRSWVIGTIVAVLIIAGLIVLQQASPAHSNKLQVTATFYPMAEFARQVGGKNAAVTTLVKPGIEPHDYEPTPQDVAAIYKSKLFVYNGAGLERWVDKIQNDLAHTGTFVVDATYNVKLLGKDPSDTENTSATDPHVWMDPALAVQEVQNVLKGFIATDPKNVETYQANAKAYIAQLNALNQEFKTGLNRCQSHDIVTSHQAFSYLANEYGLHAVGIAGLSPDNEPSPQKLAEIADFARANNVHYIFFETLVSPKLSQTIASEVGAQTIAFNPLEGLTPQEAKAGKNYISVQKDNLQALRTALNCK
jgi:zinc transport system substrate-binding protein